MTYLHWRRLFIEPLHGRKPWGIVFVIIGLLALTPQVTPTDWSLNTDTLSDGLTIYHNPDFVYPPWALILLWPYRLMSARGSLVITGLVVAWLCFRRQWSLSRYLATILHPYFVFTLMFSNVDILVMIFPLLLWETTRDTPWQVPAWGTALALLLLKPQGGLLIIPYLLWRCRQYSHLIVSSLLITGLFVVPISLLGSPPLISQWLDNLAHPSKLNQESWRVNSVSLGHAIGLIAAASTIATAVTGLYALMRRFNRAWTQHHTLAALFLFTMLVSPYTSHQSLVVPATLVPSWPAVAFTYTGILIGEAAGLYKDFAGWWTLFFVLSAMWFFQDARVAKAETGYSTSAANQPPF